MTAAEIKKALKPFADFAPAIMKAAEIVHDAEQAEATLKKYDKALADRKAEIDTIEEQFKTYAKKAETARAEFQEEIKRINAQRQDLLDQLAPHRKELAEIKIEIDEVKQARAATIGELNDQIKELTAKRKGAEDDFKEVLKRHAG